jgi:serine/threonine protein kinase
MTNEDNAKTVVRTRRMPFKPGPNSDPGQSVNVLPVGTHLGEFEILNLIGEGGFGIVYLAYDHSLERHVALKEYMPSGLATRTNNMAVTVRSQHNAETFTAGLKSFINEARMLAQFDSPALVKVHRFWEGNGTAYMVMPFYEGTTLKQALKERRITPTESWIRLLLADLFDAIETIHHAHCLHRDIAPDNILLLKDGRPLLLDFGAARRVIGDLTQCLTVILKPGFAPIEQYADIAGLRQGEWTDIYALAAVVYYLITGKAPPPAVARMVHDELVPARKAGKGRYSDAFLAVLDKALSVKPEQRFRSIDELRRALDIMETVPRTIPGESSHWATTVVRPTVMADRKPEPKPGIRQEARPAAQPAPRQNPNPKLKAEPYIGTVPNAIPEAQPAAKTEIKPQARPQNKPQIPPSPQPATPPYSGTQYRPQMAYTGSSRAMHGKQRWLILGLVLAAGIGSGVYVGTHRSWDESRTPAATASSGGSGLESSGSSGTADQETPDQAAATPPATPAPAASPHVNQTPPPTANTAPASPPADDAQSAEATARQLSEIDMWRAVSAANEASGYQNYLREYPQGRYATLARIRLERMQPKTAMIAPAETAPAKAAPPQPDEEKPKTAPGTPNATAAPKAAASKREERLWSTVTSINESTAYEAYLHQYPKGRYAPLAKDRLASIKARRQAASAEASMAKRKSTQDVATSTETAASATPDASVAASASPPLPEPPPAASAASNMDKQASIKPSASSAPAPTTSLTESTPSPAPQSPITGSKKTITVGDQVMTGDFSVDPKTGIVSGTGKIVWANGDRFEGTMVNGKKEGKGKFIWHNGQRYNGDWAHDVPNGKGSIVFADGSRYEGDVKDGMPHGQGTTRFKDGDVYRGAWVRGRSSGQGRYTWANGSYWEGEFRDDKPTENGTMVFAGRPGTRGAPPAAMNTGAKTERAAAGTGTGY